MANLFNEFYLNFFFWTATSTQRFKSIGNITTKSKYTSKSSGNNNNRSVFIHSKSSTQSKLNQSQLKKRHTNNIYFVWISTVSTTMDNSMGQIVPMTSLALSQSMDSVNTATNEEEVCTIYIFNFLKRI